MKRLAALFALPAALPALAHDGHGAVTQLHWHATDTWGLAVTLALAALAIWLARK